MLNIEKCELTSPPPLVNIEQTLSKLRIKNARLSFIPAFYFSGCEKLIELELSHNRLSALPDLSAISDTLDIIRVDHNELIDITSLQDLTFSKLRYLFLDHNKIQQVDIMRFHMPRLHEMGLTHNLLQEFGHPKWLVRGDDGEYGPRAVNVRLHLGGNPWYCNQNLSWIASALQVWHDYMGSVDLYWNGSTVHVIDAQAMICYFPPSVRGTPAIHLGKYQSPLVSSYALVTRLMGPSWSPPGADRTQMGPMLAPWLLLFGYSHHPDIIRIHRNNYIYIRNQQFYQIRIFWKGNTKHKCEFENTSMTTHTTHVIISWPKHKQ